jgi:hypothetical protein
VIEIKKQIEKTKKTKAFDLYCYCDHESNPCNHILRVRPDVAEYFNQELLSIKIVLSISFE